MDIRQAIAAACTRLGLERLDAQLLLLHALGRPQHDRAWLLAHDSDVLAPEAEQRYLDLTRRRAAGAPLAYLTGVREFYGLELQIDARVLDPRPDTETLVDWALERLQDLAAPLVMDLGTGSGAIALAIKAQRPDARVSALDASTDALAVAQANARRLGLEVTFDSGNWLDGVSERHDLIVSNPPYIAEGDRHLEQLGHEPQLALTSGPDGLNAIRAIVSQARTRLCGGGWLLLEHGWDQAPAVRALLAQAGFEDVQSRQDLAGIERCSGGRSPAA
jgi:release factor glutamine methyltransferase